MGRFSGALRIARIVVAVLACGAALAAPPKPTLAQLRALVAEQKAQIEEQQRQIAEQQAKLAEQATDVAEQNLKLAALEEQLRLMTERLALVEQQLPATEDQKALEDRLSKMEKVASQTPELPPNLVSAGDFPGSIRIPGTDAAIKLGGRIRTAVVFTMDPLGSEDRFLTNSIPVEPTDTAAGKGERTTFSANTSRFNFEMRTPTGATSLRTFIEGDFFGNAGVSDQRIAFRLRHAFAQFRGFLGGQTWSTFSDPAANHQDLDFEGINGENVIRQAQIRYTKQIRENLSVAGALETPQVSLTGGQGVNVVPDIVGRIIWSFKEIGHLQTAVVGRQIRGEPNQTGTGAQSVPAWGVTVSGVVPFYYFNLTDRFIFQLNAGKGIARYINDLNSLGGQDAVFDAAGGLHALPAVGWYLDYEHQWKEWERTKRMKLRSSFIWSFVTVDNLDFQPGEAYRKTNRYSVNLVFSPVERIDMGVEYIHGNRQNNNGHQAGADQVQVVGIFRF